MKVLLISLITSLLYVETLAQVNLNNGSNFENYTGAYKAGKKHGFGKVTYANGLVYEGQWVEDKKSGKGKLIDATGTVYEGVWTNDIMVGIATINYSDGSVYKGAVSSFGIRNGIGKLIYASKTVYEGEWRNGLKNGSGRLIDPVGTSYEGQWQNDTMVGIANINYTDGSTYTGEVSGFGIRNGKGKVIESNKTVYNGQWKDGKKNGNGKLIDINGTSYIGEWKNDIMTGMAVINNPDGSKYEGAVSKNGLADGEGTFTFSNGNSLVGTFINGTFIQGEFIDKQTKGSLKTYTGTFAHSKIYTGICRQKSLDCVECGVIIEEYKNGKLTGRKTENKYNKDKEYEKKRAVRKDRRVTVGLAISGGLDYARLKNADSDIIDSSETGYSPSVFLNVRLAKKASVDFSLYYSSKNFKFSNFGNNYEYQFNNLLSYNTEGARLHLQEYGGSINFNYRFLFVGAYFSKLISAERSGNIYCTDLNGNVFLQSSNFQYDFFKEQDFPTISGQRPMNKYAYGISFGLSGRSDRALIGIGYDLNLSNYINNSYPAGNDLLNIDFYNMNVLGLGINYLYAKLGYIF